MAKIQFISHSEEDTMKMAERLAKLLCSGSIVCLTGNLGSGKTTFVKGLARGLKVKPLLVHSPTFVLMNSYKGKLPLYHFDLYRIDDIKEVVAIGYEEFLYGQGVSVIEWAEKMGKLLPKEYLSIALDYREGTERLIQAKAFGKQYINIMDKLGIRDRA